MGRMIMSRIIFACFAFAFALGGKVIGIITAVSQRMEGGRRAHTRKSDWLVVWVHHGGRAGATHRACIVIYVDHIMIPPISLRRLRSVFFSFHRRFCIQCSFSYRLSGLEGMLWRRMERACKHEKDAGCCSVASVNLEQKQHSYS